VKVPPQKKGDIYRPFINLNYPVVTGTSGANIPDCHNTIATTITTPAQIHLFLSILNLSFVKEKGDLKSPFSILVCLNNSKNKNYLNFKFPEVIATKPT
jgi:hypothetical protein